MLEICLLAYLDEGISTLHPLEPTNHVVYARAVLCRANASTQITQLNEGRSVSRL
ncbi:hypothetical protein BDZ89DRAFT_1071187, partial [Hymenopellis radicata]